MDRRYPTLNKVPPGSQVRVRKFGGPRTLWLRMVALGLHPGVWVHVHGPGEPDGTVEVSVQGSRLTLPPEDAARIFVKV